MDDKFLDVANNSSYTIFMFILALFSAWSWQLLPSKIIDMFETDRRTQLVVLFVLILFTLDLFKPELSFHKNLLNATLIFALYLIITKQSVVFFISTVVLLMLNAIITNYIRYYEKQPKSAENSTKIKWLKTVLKCTLIGTIGIVLYGVVTYYMKQYHDHREQSANLFEFLVKFLLAGSVKQQKTTGSIL